MMPADRPVPEWVNWIAQDSDGSWWGYQVEPLQNHRGWYENEVGNHVRLGATAPGPDWQTSLKKINHAPTVATGDHGLD